MLLWRSPLGLNAQVNGGVSVPDAITKYNVGYDYHSTARTALMLSPNNAWRWLRTKKTTTGQQDCSHHHEYQVQQDWVATETTSIRHTYQMISYRYVCYDIICTYPTWYLVPGTSYHTLFLLSLQQYHICTRTRMHSYLWLDFYPYLVRYKPGTCSLVPQSGLGYVRRSGNWEKAFNIQHAPVEESE